MRALKTSLVVMLIALGFLVGYFAGWRVHGENVVRLSPREQDKAAKAAQLEQRILEELQGRYYKPVSVDKLSKTSIDAMLESLDDPYTAYLPPAEAQALEEDIKGEYSGIGAALQKVKAGVQITHVFEGSPAEEAGLAPGDVIVTVDGTSTQDADLQASVARIKGEAGTKVRLTLRKEGEDGTVDVELTRRTISIPLTRTRVLKTGADTVGYVQLYEFSENAGQDVRDEIEKVERRGAEWIVFDLRFNGGGLLSEAIDVSGDFMTGKVVSTKGLHSPLKVYTADEQPATDLPVVVLVDQFTASASEIVTGALKDTGRATIIGTTTFGKGVVQSILPMENGGIFKLTIASYYTPNGTDINKIGIVPDVRASDDPKTKRDEALQRALLYIRTH